MTAPDPKRVGRFMYEDAEVEVDNSGASGEPLAKEEKKEPATVHVYLPAEDEG